MRGFDTNVRTGFAYNNKLSINGKTYNGTTSNVESGLCVFTENSVGNMQQFTGGKVNLGKPGVSEEEKKFYELVLLGKNKLLLKNGDPKIGGKLADNEHAKFLNIKAKMGK